MKIADYISKTIQEYPSLYKDVDYEKSKLKVLCQIFFTVGNGLEMAETIDPSEGGYVVEPKYKKDKKTGDWIRVKDKPYGEEKYKSIPKGYFDNIIYYVHAGKPPIETFYKKRDYFSDVYFRYDKTIDNKFDQPRLYKAESLYPFSPYPFSKDFSIACNVFYKDIFLQDDWMQELIILCKRTLEYFNDKTQYENNSHYPTEEKIKMDLRYFENFEKDLSQLNHLQKIWGYEVKESIPDYTEVQIVKNNNWENFHKKQTKFLIDFLLKYNVV